MDAGAFMQENKRWLVICAIAGLVWWIASGVIEAVYNPGDYVVSARKLGAPSSAFQQTALNDAQEESELLAAERQRLQTELAFVVSDKYTQWTGPADQYLYVAGRNLKRQIADEGGERDVLVESGGISWDKPTGVDEIKSVLFGLDLIDEIQQRLFAAHDKSLAHDEDARGLIAIKTLKLESQRGRRQGRRSRRDKGVDIADLLEQQRVNLTFEADEPTIAYFLEACRKQNRTLVLDKWSMTAPARPGEPCVVKGALSGIAFKTTEEQP